MIKLVVSDVDGTLVKDGTLEINPEYMDVIKKLRKKECTLQYARADSTAAKASFLRL